MIEKEMAHARDEQKKEPKLNSKQKTIILSMGAIVVPYAFILFAGLLDKMKIVSIPATMVFVLAVVMMLSIIGYIVYNKIKK